MIIIHIHVPVLSEFSHVFMYISAWMYVSVDYCISSFAHTVIQGMVITRSLIEKAKNLLPLQI